jgi:hypothetical protein
VQGTGLASPQEASPCAGHAVRSPVVVWRRLYAPLMPGLRAIHPLELPLAMEAGVATPALAERGGRWAADHTQRQVLER